ncbi:unnamed protein product [Caenorhabditis brenneri]
MTDQNAPPPSKRRRYFVAKPKISPQPSSSLPRVAQKYILKNMKNVVGECKVCGCPASEVCYGVLACEQCRKCFMHFQGVQSTCPSNGHCEVAFHRPPICNSCRFEKCLRVGMRDEVHMKNLRFPQQIKDIYAIHLEYCDYTKERIRRVVASDFGYKIDKRFDNLTNRIAVWKLYSEVMERDIETSGRFMQYLENQFEAPDRATLLRKQAFKVYLLKISQSLDYKGLYLPDGRFINFSVFTLLYGYQLANDMVQMAGKVREWISCDEDLAIVIVMTFYSPWGPTNKLLDNPGHLAEVFTEYKRKCRLHFREQGHSPLKMDRMMRILQDMVKLEKEIDTLCDFLGRHRGAFDEDSLFCEIYCHHKSEKEELISKRAEEEV